MLGDLPEFQIAILDVIVTVGRYITTRESGALEPKGTSDRNGRRGVSFFLVLLGLDTTFLTGTQV